VDIGPFDESVVDELTTFTCGDDDLDDFIRSDAAALQRGNVVRTYLARYEGNVEGYVSLLTDAVVLETRERKKLALGSGAHPIVPALKVARLAVSASFRAMHRGLGEVMMRFALSKALDIADQVGCRVLTVDAYPASIAFYENLGFVRNRAKQYQGREHPSMRLDIFPPEAPSWAR
jgi:ribosomal protein S18 acetylase RimI-like enzyme